MRTGVNNIGNGEVTGVNLGRKEEQVGRRRDMCKDKRNTNNQINNMGLLKATFYMNAEATPNFPVGKKDIP